MDHKNIEEYRNHLISQYGSEEGYRVDFGTKRSKLIDTIKEARELIDYYLSPNK